MNRRLAATVICWLRETDITKRLVTITYQATDTILHLPAKQWGLRRQEGNFAVWALKHRSLETEAREDFQRLDEMFTKLKYPLGFFINIGSQRTFENIYRGDYAKRVHCISCCLNADGTLSLSHAQPRP
ncbi:MAG TPA: hypothetical protein VIR01_15285 [Pyrinomonadaceae bacterium]